MKRKLPNALARALRDFFGDYLPGLRGMSPYTIQSYRDALVLLLRFLASAKRVDSASLDLDDITPEQVIAFLRHLEKDRHNATSTRNVRLAAIHAFFRHGIQPWCANVGRTKATHVGIALVVREDNHEVGRAFISLCTCMSEPGHTDHC